MAQHLSLGVQTAPGLVGAELGLVWFHFGINLAVYAGMMIGLAKARFLQTPLLDRVPEALRPTKEMSARVRTRPAGRTIP